MYRLPTRSRTASGRRGVAAVEFAVVAVFLVPLLIGLWEVGRLVEVQQFLNGAAREGGRQASTAQKDQSGVQTAIINYCKQNGITVQASDITITNLDNTDQNPQNANQLERIQVTIKIKFDSVRWILLNQITNTQYLYATVEWRSMKDIPLSVNTSIPLQ